MLPGTDLFEALRKARAENGRQALHTALAMHLPKRLAQLVAEEHAATGNLADFSDKALRASPQAVNDWRFKPAGSEGYRTAEVTLGGVDTRDLDSRTMAARDGARPLFHRRGGGRHRLARRLQFPMGLVVRLVRRAGCLKANRLFPPPCGEG